MCIICVELDKNKLTPWEARRNLTEMRENLDEEHAREVEQKISDAIFNDLTLNYGDTITQTVEYCEICEDVTCLCTIDQEIW